MMNVIASLLLSWFASTSWAAMDLPTLVESFNPHWPTFYERMKTARTLDGVLEAAVAEEEMGFTECGALETKILAQYPHSPFDIKFSGGKFSVKLCPKNARHSLKEGVLRTKETLASYFFTREIALTDEGKFKTWKELWVSRKDEAVRFYYDASVDQDENIYAHYWNNEVNDSKRKILGPYHKMTFISVIGQTPEPWSMVEHTDKINSTHNRKLYRMSFPTAEDWTSYFTPLSFFKMGGIYTYDQTLSRQPKNALSTRVFELNNERQCMIGLETKEGKGALIPEDFNAYTQCALQ